MTPSPAPAVTARASSCAEADMKKIRSWADGSGDRRRCALACEWMLGGCPPWVEAPVLFYTPRRVSQYTGCVSGLRVAGWPAVRSAEKNTTSFVHSSLIGHIISAFAAHGYILSSVRQRGGVRARAASARASPAEYVVRRHAVIGTSCMQYGRKNRRSR
jgi:hypothetical protein